MINTKYLIRLFYMLICFVQCMLFFSGKAYSVVLYDQVLVNDPYTLQAADHATVAANDKGYFLVVWNEHDASLNPVYSVKGRFLHGTTGGANSPIISISSTLSPYNNVVPDVATDGKDHFVVVWSSQIPNGPYQVKAKILAPSGKVLIDTFIVNDSYLLNGNPVPAPRPNLSSIQDWPSKKSFLYVNFPDVTMNKNGDFLVVWDQWDGIQQNRYIRYFNKQGKALSTAIQLNNFTTTLAYSGLPDVDMNNNGDVIVAWGEQGVMGVQVIAYRYFNLASGVFTGNEKILYPSINGYDQVRPMVSINAVGDALISWSEQIKNINNTVESTVYAMKYNAISQTWSSPLSPSMNKKPHRSTGVLLSTGEVVFGYSPIISGDKDVVVERYSANLLMSVDVTTINQKTLGTQRRAAFSMVEKKYNWLITTFEDESNSFTDIYARVMRLN